jgi:hypothetical protein
VTVHGDGTRPASTENQLRCVMPQQSQRSQQPSPVASQLVIGLVEGVIRSTALTVEIFLHRGFGVRYIDCGLLGMVVMFVFAMCFPDQNTRPLLCFMAVYGVVWLITTICTLIRFWRGKNVVHSLYTGRPFLWRLLESWREQNVKYVEALLVILLGYGVHHLNRPLGDYLMVAASVVLLRGYNIAAQRRLRAMEMNDSVIEQRLVAERFRDMQGS